MFQVCLSTCFQQASIFTCFQSVFQMFFCVGRGWSSAIGTLGGGVGGMFTPPGPPLALRNLTHVAHDITNGLKVARATELTSVTPLAAQGGGAARDFENSLKTRETYLKTYLIETYLETDFFRFVSHIHTYDSVIVSCIKSSIIFRPSRPKNIANATHGASER